VRVQRSSIVAAKTLLNFLEQRLQGVAGKLQLVLDGKLRALELKASPVFVCACACVCVCGCHVSI